MMVQVEVKKPEEKRQKPEEKRQKAEVKKEKRKRKYQIGIMEKRI